MTIFLIVCSVLCIGYVFLMILYSFGWQVQKKFTVEKPFLPITTISIIIPARNEEHHIEECIKSVLANNYPESLLEIIIIDDHSTDDTVQLIKKYEPQNVKCIQLSDFIKQDENLNSYKKKALQTGIDNSVGELIVTTDADCIVKTNWLKNIAAIYEQENPAMIVGPVICTSNNSLVETFQSLDFMTMQGITAASHRLKLGNMSNGANLAFSRKAFDDVRGYEGVDHLASGDDYLLMMKINHQFPKRISYLKTQDAIVTTAPQPDWKSFFNQRIRWASKSGKYDDKKLTSILLLVYLFNLSLVLLFFTGFWEHQNWLLLSGILLIKNLMEIYFLLPVSSFFEKRKQVFWFPFLQPLHIIYIVSAGLLGFVGVYEWKGRRVR